LTGELAYCPWQDCSVLAFVLDHLLPQTQSVGDKDTPALARLFLASLAAATQSTEAQAALVNEVKAALSRALAMAESTEKHARLQAVMFIISTIMESCPSTSSFYSSNAVKAQHNGMNNIIRLFLKKGLVNDLARVPHSLDLSSPNMANTVNAALKPLETLSRIVNQPSSLFSSKNASSKNKSEQDTNITSSDANGNQPEAGETGETEAHEDHAPTGVGDNDIMDGEPDADTVVITGQSEVLNAQEMQVENELEDLIDELLERDVDTVSSTIIACRSTEDESQEDVLMDEAPSNLSQAPTLQANREDSMNILDPDDEEHTQEEDSSGSNEDDDDSQDEDEEEEEDEDDQDDEEGEEEEGDEDDEDEEGSEMELDEDYPDIDESLVRFDREDDLIIEFDNMFSTAADIPPAPGNIPATHPLMVRHADHSALTLGTGSSTTRLTQGIGRSQRAIRPFAANTGHTIHVHYPGNRQPNPPLILQRLLGPSAAADILQLSSSLPLQSRGRARLLVGNDDVHIIARSDDDLLDDFFHDQTATTSQAGTLSSIPTALTRWTEECKVLDAESMHDCVAVVKVPVIQHLESLRDEELEERREKRRKQLAEEEARRDEKAKEEKENKELNPPAADSTGAANSTVQADKNQTGVCSSALSATNEAISNIAASIAEAALEAMRTHGQLADAEQPVVGSTGLDTPRLESFLPALTSMEGSAAAETPALEAAPLPGERSSPLRLPATQEEAAAAAAAAIAQSLMPLDPAEGAPERAGSDAEALQMEMSPAPTNASQSPERVEGSDALVTVGSQLEGSPMDTSSPVSGILEEAAAEGLGPGVAEQERTGAEERRQPAESAPAAEVRVETSTIGELSVSSSVTSVALLTRDGVPGAVVTASSEGQPSSHSDEDPLADAEQPVVGSTGLDTPRLESFLPALTSMEGSAAAETPALEAAPLPGEQSSPLRLPATQEEAAAAAAAAIAQSLMPLDPAEGAPERAGSDAEALQMEMSPAPTNASQSPERVEGSDALVTVGSQLEGSPMDTSSPVSGILEEAAAEGLGPGVAEQERTGAEERRQPAESAPAAEVRVETSTIGELSVSSSVTSVALLTRDGVPGAVVTASSEGQPSSHSDEDPLAGISLPEGVDPSFLAALPEDIRREVLQNQLGIRPPSRAAATVAATAAAAAAAAAATLVGNQSVTEVSPEFLAALPPAIQEEVLAQQRVEQQRRELAQTANSDTPMDPVTFIQTLPSDLRRSVLEDMEDSVLAVMPPDIAAEAQALRREQEARQRQLMHERLFSHSSSSALSAILRSTGFTGRLGGNRGVQYTRLAVQRSGAFQWGSGTHNRASSSSNVDSLLRLRGRLLLDHEALSCLLVLLFVDEPKLNTSRLHRVLRNLCYHTQTRNWVIKSLLSILQRSSESELCIETPKHPEEKGKRATKAGATASAATAGHEHRPLDLLHKMEAKTTSQLSWLSVSMDAALGCRTNIFQIQRSGGRKHSEKHVGCGSTVHIHPQAAPVVCRHVLDTLIQLAKVFPSHFTQQKAKETASETDKEKLSKPPVLTSPCLGQPVAVGTGGGGGGSVGGGGGSYGGATASGISTDFWDLLVKLDNMNVSRKGKTSVKVAPTGASEGESSQCSLESSPLGQLMNMLSHPVIRRSSLLTEKLLRLLSLISIALPDKATEVAVSHGAAAEVTLIGPVTPTPKPTKSPAKATSEVAVGANEGKAQNSGLTEKQLQLSVEVLTSHSCSEEGLEDAANILLQLSRGEPGTRDTVLKLLLSGARQLGYTLCQQIGTLLAELREYNLDQQRSAQSDCQSPEGTTDDQPQLTKLKGKMQSRFDTAEDVVIVASHKRALGGRELQLPSMSMLTSKTSTQKFFLRILQVIIQLRDATRRANKKAKQTGRLGTSALGSATSIQAAVRQLEAEADAIIQMVREGQRARRQQQSAMVSMMLVPPAGHLWILFYFPFRF
ncbi:E3 ubiquitin-protein ligase HUWE1-like, partial [Amblyraja radiata]|uniref:E3 ubiquitin-protein ligase HUWE1-like n=1 Tax=Amblyraja radiata TaxID=386614 RepID=UPI001403F3DA